MLLRPGRSVLPCFGFPKGNRGGGVREMGARENHPLLHVVWHGCYVFLFCVSIFKVEGVQVLCFLISLS